MVAVVYVKSASDVKAELLLQKATRVFDPVPVTVPEPEFASTYAFVAASWASVGSATSRILFPPMSTVLVASPRRSKGIDCNLTFLGGPEDSPGFESAISINGV